MIDWSAIEAQLAALAADALPARLLSVSVPLPRWPDATLPLDATGDWCAWQRPDRGLRLLGFGKALAATSAGAGRFAALQAAQRGLADGWRHSGDAPPPLAFAGFAFAPHGGGPLPNATLRVPALLLRRQDDAVWLTLSCAADRADAAVTYWRALWEALERRSRAVPPAPSFATQPNALADAAFLARGRAALRAIAAGAVDKLVLTRRLRLQADTPVAAEPVLAALAARHPACATFGIAQRGKAFVGASPETLLAADGPRVAVDALAGTAWQGAALELGADKNRREQAFVAHAVAAALGDLCDDIAVPAAEELRLDTLTHLRQRVAARRPAGVGVFDLIARLHPTPAVGGTPTAAALDWLARHGDRRGAWYTGGFGWVDAAGDCDIAVALRCGLLDGRSVTLYAGAGFVAGADPLQELAETEAKLAPMRAALAAASSPALAAVRTERTAA